MSAPSDEAELIANAPTEVAPPEIDPLHILLAGILTGDVVPIRPGDRVDEKYEIASGPVGDPSGQGEVYRARDTVTGQLVALKLLRGSRVELAREAKATAALDNEHIVRFHTWGEFQGRSYLVLEWVNDAKTLSEHTSMHTPAFAGILRIAIQIGDAVAHAHLHGVMHRDLKPDNILVDETGHVTVIDFGLSVLEHATDDAWRSATAGTRPYMSPEQLRGEKQTLATDVWGLGVVLYELFTRARPFPTPEAILGQPPADLGRVPWPFRRIVGRALSKKPGARPTAGELLRVLENVQRARRVLIAAPFVAAVVLLAVLVGTSLIRAPNPVVTYPVLTRASEDRQARAGAILNQAREPGREREAIGEALELIATARRDAAEPPAKVLEALSVATASVRRVQELRGPTWAEFDPVNPRRILTIEASGLQLRDLVSHQVVQTFPGSASRATFSADGEIVGSAAHSASVWKQGGEKVTVADDDDEFLWSDYVGIRAPAALVFDDDEPLPPPRFVEELLVTTGKAWITVWDLPSKQRLGRLATASACPHGIQRATFTADANELFIACGGRHGFWSWREKGPLAKVLRAKNNAFNRSPSEILLDSRKKEVLTSDAGSLERFADLESDQVQTRATPNGTRVEALGRSANGMFVAVGSAEGSITVLRAKSLEVVWRLNTKLQRISHVGVSSDGRVALAAGDGVVRVLYKNPNLFSRSFSGASRITSAAFSSTMNRVVIGYESWKARVWDLGSDAFAPLREFGGEGFHGGPVNELSLSTDGHFALVMGASDARVRDVDREKWNNDLDGHHTVFSGEISPDGTRALTLPKPELWDIARGARIAALGDTDVDKDTVEAHFDVPGEQVVVRVNGGDYVAWNARTGVRIGPVAARPAWWPLPDAYDPDPDKRVRIEGEKVLLRIGSGATVSLAEHAGPVSRACLAPDGILLATTHEDGVARLWRVETGERIAVLKGHDAALSFATFSPDGRWLLTGDVEGRAHLFPATEQGIIEAACAAVEGTPALCSTFRASNP